MFTVIRPSENILYDQKALRPVHSELKEKNQMT